jgi:glycosyltransferase involved in cell wall biosynthesis
MSSNTKPLRVALVHDWLTGMRGGEAVLEAIIDLFPGAELFTLLHVPGSVSEKISSLKIHTSWLQSVPQAEKRYRHFLPLMPSMIESFDLTGFDLVISSSHCVAKGIRKPPGSVHVSYVHAPMRYIWDRYEDYFGPKRASPWVRAAAWAVRKRLQNWDRMTSSEDRVDYLIANSHFIATQIEAAYGRKASVVHPFVDLARFNAPRAPGNFYLMVGAFAPNKRVDLAIRAFNMLGLPLFIVGGGQEAKRLKAMAMRNVMFMGSLSNTEIASLYSRCRAFVFPGLEDFGITPLEAMAAGAPVVAFGVGGVLETVTQDTGIFFMPQTEDELISAISELEKNPVKFLHETCRKRAAEFSREHFQKKFMSNIEAAWTAAGKSVNLLPQSLAK